MLFTRKKASIGPKCKRGVKRKEDYCGIQKACVLILALLWSCWVASEPFTLSCLTFSQKMEPASPVPSIMEDVRRITDAKSDGAV